MPFTIIKQVTSYKIICMSYVCRSGGGGGRERAAGEGVGWTGLGVGYLVQILQQQDEGG